MPSEKRWGDPKNAKSTIRKMRTSASFYHSRRRWQCSRIKWIASMYSTGLLRSAWLRKARDYCRSLILTGSTSPPMRPQSICSTIFSNDYTDERRGPFLEEETIKDDHADQLKNILR